MELGDKKRGFYYDFHDLVYRLSQLPHMILKNHSLDGLSQMILHELGHGNAFDLKKAVYLVDNPDFDRLVGAAGFHCDECKHHKSDLWDSPHTFTKDMELANFHNEVRNIMCNSINLQEKNLKNLNDCKELENISKNVGISNPDFISWNMKHGNHGILLFEKPEKLEDSSRGLLENSTALLSLCGF